MGIPTYIGSAAQKNLSAPITSGFPMELTRQVAAPCPGTARWSRALSTITIEVLEAFLQGYAKLWTTCHVPITPPRRASLCLLLSYLKPASGDRYWEVCCQKAASRPLPFVPFAGESIRCTSSSKSPSEIPYHLQCLASGWQWNMICLCFLKMYCFWMDLICG